MSIEQLEQAVLGLSHLERRRFLDWLCEHEDELVGDDDEIHPEVRVEVLRRRAEALTHPELLAPVTSEWFENLKRRLADARTRKAPAR